MTESAEDVTVEVGDGEGGLVKAENQPPVKGESPTQPVVASAVTAAGSSARTPDKSEVRLECSVVLADSSFQFKMVSVCSGKPSSKWYLRALESPKTAFYPSCSVSITGASNF